jgi:hypothetical protein
MKIFANGQELDIANPTVSYDDIVQLIHGPGAEKRIWTVVYHHARNIDRRDGCLLPGQSVTIDEGCRFGAYNTSNA